MSGLTASPDQPPLADGWVSVVVPATSANLGPGFDALGLALSLRDRVSARFVSGTDVAVDVAGEGCRDVPTDASNLVARTIRIGLATFDESGELGRRGLQVRCENVIPHGRGLGSSAAAIVGGLAVAALLAGRRIGGEPGSGSSVSLAELIALSTWLEGHPDNVAPAVLGGATVAWLDPVPVQETGSSDRDASVGRAASLRLHPALTPVLMVPEVSASTHRARGALPPSVPFSDATFNAGRSALLVHALTAEPRLLLPATEDRLHQWQRREVYPESLALVASLRSAGIPAAISGAGPSVIAFAADLPGCVPVARVRDELAEVSPAGSRVEVLEVSRQGVHGSQVDSTAR